jgi:uncharacterized protein (DUF169 family)
MNKKEAVSTNWAVLAREMEYLLRLKTSPVAYKRLEKVEELDKIPGVMRLDRKASFCQAPALARMGGMTIGLTRDNVGERCARICGLATTTKEQIKWEANAFATSWFANVGEASKQMAVYPLVPAGEAVVVGPLESVKFDPDVILIYGNPAQMMLLMNALQFKDYRRFQFFFIGEGACADSLAQCYTTGEPALAIPCMGERVFGAVTEDEMVIALPPGIMTKAVQGLKALRERRIGYPIMYLGPLCDPSEFLTQIYPDWYSH